MTPEQFMSRVSPEPNSGCWLWVGCLNDKGYGVFHSRQTGRIKAHRLSWVIHRGKLDPAIRVLHRCDVPGCVNPAHLFLGTQGDNNKDRDSKGRQSKGTRNGSAKLCDSDIRLIRSLAGRLSGVKIAARFGVDHRTIHRILKRELWRHLQ